jgi:hypothetical protein
MNTGKSVLGMITMILLLIVILGLGIDSVSNNKKAIFNNMDPENTRTLMQYDNNYHIQRGSLPYSFK